MALFLTHWFVLSLGRRSPLGTATGIVYEFGDFRLDCGAFELLRDGRSLRLERKPMELLILLASRQGQLVTRVDIAQRLWSREVFADTEHGINTAIRKLRHLLRDHPEDPQFIQTETGMGYRFVAHVIIHGSELPLAAPHVPVPPESTGAAFLPDSDRVKIAQGVTPGESKRKTWIAIMAGGVVVLALLVFMARPLAARFLHRNAAPEITSIAVLPLENLSGDPNQEYFADGMTDELTTMLARDSTLRVTSRTSVMQYKGARKPLPEITAWQLGGWRGFLQWQIARRMQQAKTGYVSPVELASYHGQLGERETTLALLEEGYKQRSPDILYIQTEPAFDFLHSDPRYRALGQRIGLPPAY